MAEFPHSRIRTQGRGKHVDTIEGAVWVTALALGSLFFGWIAYHALSIEFLHTFAVVVLIIAGLVLAGVGAFVVMIIGAIWQDRRSSKFPAKELPADKNKIDDTILFRLQAIKKIEGIVDKHMETLARRRLALVKVDHYGVVDSSEWNKEVQHFLEKVVRPELSYEEVWVIEPEINAIQDALDERVRLHSEKIQADLNFPADITHSEFEKWCAKILNQCGWKATVTKASGDQGADVLAEKQGVRIILQCKLYSGTVGNKAVQEAYTAQRHYVAAASAVVTNGSFSSSARELAATTGVLLLHYSDLNRVDSLLAVGGSLEDGSAGERLAPTAPAAR